MELGAQGRSGGILVYWDKRRWSCSDKHIGQHSITVFLKEENTDFQCAFTGVYGPCDRKTRRILWKEMGAVSGLVSMPWVIGGDFNVVRFEDEKMGRARNTRAMKEFSRTIQDLPLHGGTFTWFRGNGNQCASRIDRFLISENWDDQFKFIKQRALPRVTSDHCPIILECGEWSKGKGYFKFENMWCEHKDFNGLVEKWWNS